MVIPEFDVAMIVGNPPFSICFVTKVYSQQQQHNFELVSVPPVLAKKTQLQYTLLKYLPKFNPTQSSRWLNPPFSKPRRQFLFAQIHLIRQIVLPIWNPKKMMLNQYIPSGKLT
jgi:hypothetical protein